MFSKQTTKMILDPDLVHHIKRVTEWVKSASKGEKKVYYTGHLHFDRAFQNEIHATASAIWDMYEMGLVTLCQKRLENNEFNYIVVRTGRAWK